MLGEPGASATGGLPPVAYAPGSPSWSLLETNLSLLPLDIAHRIVTVEFRLRFSLNKDESRLPPTEQGSFRESANPPPSGIVASGRVGRCRRGDGRTVLGRPFGRTGCSRR